jgi:hypothetical protein
MRTNGNTTAATPMEITGKCVAHSYTWSDTKRARLAAQATFGAVVISPLTVIQAAEVFGVSKSAVAAELKKLGVTLRRANGNGGNGHTPVPPPRWESLTSEQRSEFLKTHFDEIWIELEARTS